MTSIVMLVHDRLNLTRQALRTLYDNTPREEFTLTLVDDASRDFRVRRLLEASAQSANAQLLRLEKSSHVLARAKNIGVAWSEQVWGRGDWLYLSDNDVAFTPGWLGKLQATALASEPQGFRLWGGQVHPYHLPLLSASNVSMSAGLNGTLVNNPGWTEHQVLDGPSWLMRWGTWDQVGPLGRESAPGTCQGEDGQWCDRLRELGGRIGVVHPAVVAHTGLTNTAGEDAPGRAEREHLRMPGVVYE